MISTDVDICCFCTNPEVCGFCRKPMTLSEPAIEALNRTYHDGCFQCRSCHVPLAGKQYYNKAGIPLCSDCYQVESVIQISVKDHSDVFTSSLHPSMKCDFPNLPPRFPFPSSELRVYQVKTKEVLIFIVMV